MRGTVLYFPGCGGGVFYRNIGLAGLTMILNAGYAVVLPEKHLCCGYPLLAAGAQDAFAENQDRNIRHLRALAQKAAELDLPISHVLTACGSCRDGMERHFIPEVFPSVEGKNVRLSDVAHFLFSVIPALPPQPAPAEEKRNGRKEAANGQAFADSSRRVLYHSPCHAEVPGVHKAKAAGIYARELAEHTGAQVSISPGCCGESGMGAMTSPAIYNQLRTRKAAQLERDLTDMPDDAPVIVGCPSCKMGLCRIFLQQGQKRRVLHTLEFLAEQLAGPRWSRKFKKLLRAGTVQGDLRLVDMAALPDVQLTDAEALEDDDAQE